MNSGLNILTITPVPVDTLAPEKYCVVNLHRRTIDKLKIQIPEIGALDGASPLFGDDRLTNLCLIYIYI